MNILKKNSFYKPNAKEKQAITKQPSVINLLFFIFASFSALLIHICKRKIYFVPVLIMIFGGVFGSLIGSAVAIRIDGGVLGKIFGGMLVFAGIYSFFSKRGSSYKK